MKARGLPWFATYMPWYAATNGGMASKDACSTVTNHTFRRLSLKVSTKEVVTCEFPHA